MRVNSGVGVRPMRGKVDMLKESGLSGAPWGTPPVGVKEGPM